MASSKQIALLVELDDKLGDHVVAVTRREDALALSFEQLAGDRLQAGTVDTPAPYKENAYRLAVGIDVVFPIGRHDRGDAWCYGSAIAPSRVARRDAPAERIGSDRRSDRPHRFSSVPGSPARPRRPLYSDRHITLTSSVDSGRLDVGCTARCCTDLSRTDVITLWADMACSTARDGGRVESRARWLLPTASIRFFSRRAAGLGGCSIRARCRGGRWAVRLN